MVFNTLGLADSMHSRVFAVTPIKHAGIANALNYTLELTFGTFLQLEFQLSSCGPAPDLLHASRDLPATDPLTLKEKLNERLAALSGASHSGSLECGRDHAAAWCPLARAHCE
jgi:hypothetical protein